MTVIGFLQQVAAVFVGVFLFVASMTAWQVTLASWRRAKMRGKLEQVAKARQRRADQAKV